MKNGVELTIEILWRADLSLFNVYDFLSDIYDRFFIGQFFSSSRVRDGDVVGCGYTPVAIRKYLAR